MRLFHKKDDDVLDRGNMEVCDIVHEFFNKSLELRKIEDKFYKVFDMNPCPMAITYLKDGVIIDINQAFADVLCIEKKDIIGKNTVSLNMIKQKDRDKVLKIVQEQGFVKNYPIWFNDNKDKKIFGLFNASIIELDDVKYILTICQIIKNDFIFLKQPDGFYI